MTPLSVPILDKFNANAGGVPYDEELNEHHLLRIVNVRGGCCLFSFYETTTAKHDIKDGLLSAIFTSSLRTGVKVKP